MEAQWFLVKLQVESLDLDIEKLVQKIEKFLILYRVKFYEVPYIKTYHMHKLTPEIDRESILYDFAKWDLEWGSLYESKNHYLQLLHSAQQNAIALANGEEIDPGSKVLISYDETKIPEEVI